MGPSQGQTTDSVSQIFAPLLASSSPQAPTTPGGDASVGVAAPNQSMDLSNILNQFMPRSQMNIGDFGATGPGADWLNWRFDPNWGNHPTTGNYIVPEGQVPTDMK